MNKEELITKYDALTNTGKLPLMFKNITFEDPKNNHELSTKKQFYSPKFNNRAMNFKYVERALMTIT